MERESGGGAVLTGPWLVSASIVLPHGHPWVSNGLLDSYRRLGLLHLAVLKEFGVLARVLPPKDLRAGHDATGFSAVDWACFGGLSPWEVVNTEGRKLVGFAQRRRQSGVLLVAGTLIGITDWPLLCDLASRPDDAWMLQRCTVSIEEMTGRQIEPALFAAVLKRWLERAFSASGEADCSMEADFCGNA